MGYRLKGGRPKNRKQGIYWVQRHRDDVRRSAPIESYDPFNARKSGPDLIGWLFILGIVALIVAAFGGNRY